MMNSLLLFSAAMFGVNVNADSYYYSRNYIYVDASNQRTWADANTYCKVYFNTALATIASSEDQVEWLSVTDNTPGGEPKWIGCAFDGGSQVKWVRDGSSCSDAVYASWHLQEGSYELDLCFAVDEPNGKWFDVSCTGKRDFTCNRPGGKYAEGVVLDVPYEFINKDPQAVPQPAVDSWPTAQLVTIDIVVSAVVCLAIMAICACGYFLSKLQMFTALPRKYKFVDADVDEEQV